jgi:hypothetical protein
MKLLLHLLTSLHGTLLPRANAAACLQLAKADFASSSRRVRDGQGIAALDDMLVHSKLARVILILCQRAR